MTDRINMRMVGVPEASLDFWIAKFVAAGHKTARVDQTETAIGKTMRERTERASSRTPTKTEKIIRRELSCILTAGTLVEPRMLSSDLATYCMAIKEESGLSAAAPVFGIAFVDTATAEFRLSDFEDDRSRTRLETLLLQLQPRELLLEKVRLLRVVASGC